MAPQRLMPENEEQQQQQHSSSQEAEVEDTSRGGPAETTSSSPDESSRIVSAPAILYSVESYNAIVRPVLTTMILSALAVIFINTPESIQANEEAFSNAYNVYGNAEDAEGGTSQQLSAALVNALVIVSVICVTTFLMVLLYKYRCMKILLGYLILMSALLLFYLSSVMFQVAIQRYQLRIDKISFWLIIFNFSFVGTGSIFFQPYGFPTYISQAYLILTSVIVAWDLSFFDTWTAWALLIMLALYDLFAVLSPCGPLKALVNLMSRDDAPEMPGLLYEARLPDAAKRPVHQQQQHQQQQPHTSQENNDNGNSQQGNPQGNGDGEDPTDSTTTNEGDYPSSEPVNSSDPRSSLLASLLPHMTRSADNPSADEASLPTNSISKNVQSCSTEEQKLTEDDDENDPEQVSSQQEQEQPIIETPQQPQQFTTHTGLIPLALAKMYKLPLVDNLRPGWVPCPTDVNGEGIENQHHEPESPQYSPEELQSLVHVIFPRNGGKILPRSEQQQGQGQADLLQRYEVVDRHGTLRRTLFVNQEGIIMQEKHINDYNEEDDDEYNSNNRIRLGLGDFIFYSILVAEAAVYSFTTFCACTLAILVGLGVTLLLLAVYKQALPALPISIFLGVIFFLLSRYLLQPWIEAIFRLQLYV